MKANRPRISFDPSKLGFLDREVIKTVPKLALLEMLHHLKQQKTSNGWLYFTAGVGTFGTAYLLRPDGYVAARFRHPTRAGLDAALARAAGHN